MSPLHLPPAMADLRAELGAIVAGIEAKAPYGAALLSANQGLTIRVEDKEETVTEIPPTAGTVLTAFDGLTVQENAISGFKNDEVRRGAQSLVDAIRFTPGNSSAPVDPGPIRQGDFASENVAGLFSIQDTLERVRALHRRLRGRDQRLVNVRVRYAEFAETSVFRNRTADLAQEVIRQVMTLMIFASGSNGVRYNVFQKGTTKGWDELAFSDDELQGLIDTTVALNDAERIDPGEYTIITSPGVSGVLCHESFGHGVETDMFLKERALAAHYLDRTIGSSLVNIFDDPSVSGAFGSYFFDAEGVLSKPTQIVENGTFRRGITDMYSAHALNLQRTANGRRQDYSRKAYARMSNTFFAPGTTPVSDLFAQVD